jgi:hypothetical protein
MNLVELTASHGLIGNRSDRHIAAHDNSPPFEKLTAA